MGISQAEAASLGVAIYKVGMPWPLEPIGIRAFAAGLETLMVVEHKRPLIETQARAALYDLPAHARPKIIGKTDENGQPLLSELGSPVGGGNRAGDRRPPAAGPAHGPGLRLPEPGLGRLDGRGHAVGRPAAQAVLLLGLPAQHLDAAAGRLAARWPASAATTWPASTTRRTDLNSHMGGEGLSWVGAAPFTDEKHVFVNLGDGTYNHSGSLAIRAAVAAGANMTYKLLFNDAVAMTGGQAAESGFTVPQITRQLRRRGRAEGRRRGRRARALRSSVDRPGARR